MDRLEQLPDRLTPLKGQILLLRTEMRDEFSAVRSELRDEMQEQGATLRAEMQTQGIELRAAIDAQGKKLDEMVTELRADIAHDRRAHEQEMVALDAHMLALHNEVIAEIKKLKG